jgi:polyisoprenoid-binding protein YceI
VESIHEKKPTFAASNTENMKSLLSIAATAALFIFASCGEQAGPAETNTNDTAAETNKTGNLENLTDGTYTVDQASSTVSWKGSKITGSEHVGLVNVHKGYINVIDKGIANGFVAVDMNTMVCTDEEMDDDTKGNLIGHLQSDDFFGVEQFPYARLEMEGIKVKGDVAMGYGKIFIREIGQPISFPVQVSSENNNIVVDATVTVDRSKHDVKFRSGSFPDLFPDLGDNLINDEIELEVHILASL